MMGARGGGLSGRRVGVLIGAGWGVWAACVSATNVSELFRAFGWTDTTYRSGNLAFIQTALTPFTRSKGVAIALLLAAIALELLAVFLIARGLCSLRRLGATLAAALRAGLAVIALLGLGFAIVTEATIAYDRGIREDTYWTLFIAAIATLIVASVLDREPVT